MSRFIVVMLVSASVTGVVSLASAQVAPARYAAIEKCVQQAQAQYPDTATGTSQTNARYSVYAACMKAAGQEP
jgi:uncharacterized cupredoxin-like copper-binding protein